MALTFLFGSLVSQFSDLHQPLTGRAGDMQSSSPELSGPSLHTSSWSEMMVMWFVGSSGNKHRTSQTCLKIAAFEEFLHGSYLFDDHYGRGDTRVPETSCPMWDAGLAVDSFPRYHRHGATNIGLHTPCTFFEN